LSLDEAYLDVTENKPGFAHATPIAREIRSRIRSELHLTGSAGVSYCKFLAKVASDMNKPDGLTVIRPDQARGVIDRLPVGSFFGVGPVTERKLREAGIATGADVHRSGEAKLTLLLGRVGAFLWRLSDGRDDREVESDRERKSVGAEDTFAHDETDLASLVEFLSVLASRVVERQERAGVRGRTVTVKVKFGDFHQVTRSRTFLQPIVDANTLVQVARELLADTQAGELPVRLLGIQVSQFGVEEAGEEGIWEQLELPLGMPLDLAPHRPGF